MIIGRSDTWFTIDEFADMVGREPKTVMDLASEGAGDASRATEPAMFGSLRWSRAS